MSGLFCIANLLELGRKKTIFLIFWLLTPSNVYMINVKAKVFWKKDIETHKKQKAKKKKKK